MPETDESCQSFFRIVVVNLYTPGHAGTLPAVMSPYGISVAAFSNMKSQVTGWPL